MSARSKSDKGIVVGGEPRIDFLPPEIKRKKQARRTFRGLIALVVLVVALCVVAYGGVTTVSIAKQIALSEEQQRTLDLLKKQQEFSTARQVADDIALTTQARLFGSSREILWQPYLAEIEARLPADTVTTQLSIDSLGSMDPDADASNPFLSTWIATIGITGTTPTYNGVSALLDNVKTLPGFAGATVSNVTYEEGVGFEFSMAVAVSEIALAKRFFIAPPAAEEADAAESEEQA